jgi:putative methyltransferase (TIGR04325 family)
MELKRAAKRHLPPSLLDCLTRVYQRVRLGGAEWEYCGDGWVNDDPNVKGWNVDSVVATQKTRWPAFLELTGGRGPLGVAHEAPTPRNDDYYAHHIVMAYAYVLALAAHMKDRISVLDWGGGLGHYGVLSQRLMPGLEIDYTCKDLPLLCDAGRAVYPEAQFLDSDQDLSDASYDLVIASGALQCSEDWKRVVRLLASSARPYLYVTRLPIVRESKSFVALQRVYAYGYDTEFMCWFLNRDDLVETVVSAGLSLVREFVFNDHPVVSGAPERARIQGFLFKAG